MSKKIIYLLSLLMALSLVFASCKKNDGITGGNIDGNPPDEGGDTSMTDPDTGLMTKWSDIPAEGYIKKTTIFKPTDKDFFRNPVVVVLGTKNSKVAVFTEKRYAANGGVNDVGITGELVVDIAWTLSGNSGNSFNYNGFVNQGNTSTTKVADSHGAPVVFKVSGTQVVIAASAGAGIGRVSKSYSERQAEMPSRIDYIVGTLDESNNTFSWSEWKTILKGTAETDDLGKKVASIKSGANKNFDQFATHSAKGYVQGNELYLPVVMAYQGTTSDAYELMGVIMVTGTWNGSTDVTSWKMGNNIAFDKADDKFSKYKESRVLGLSSSDVKYLVVPNPSKAGNIVAQGTIATSSQQPTPLSLAGSEGSPGYIDFGTDKWFGTQEYTININDGTFVKKSADPIANRGLYMHSTAQFKNVTLYLVNNSANLQQLSGSKSVLINAQGKSSSIDMLGDGTVVIAAEEGAKSGEKDFYVSFTRYGQGALATMLGETAQ
ncbi:hypothetical protein [Fusobacterium necrogenes]|uniref:hypothetical protein n=1 Tax=Fusobacterium necrogenes TaxID=858 RepID=UPI00255CEAFD|nr:hypothetical protein [Fusobacterium necrogenes]